MPGCVHICPNKAACWSPAIPAMGILCAVRIFCVVPYTSLLLLPAGNIEAGTVNILSNSSSHCKEWILNNMVRDALDTSVACVLPLVSFHRSQLSTVPKHNSPLPAFSLAPGTLSRIHFTLVAE